MTTKPLTKDQRKYAIKKAKEAARKQSELEMGQMPEYLKATEPNISPTPKSELEPIEKVPSYMRDGSDPSGNYVWNDDKIRAATKKAGNAKSRKHEIEIKELKAKYPNHWGKRGGPKYIVYCEHEQDPETKLSLRAVQAYFKATRT